MSAVKVGGQKRNWHYEFEATFYYVHMLRARTCAPLANILFNLQVYQLTYPYPTPAMMCSISLENPDQP